MKPHFDLSVLLEMLTYKRPAGSDTEQAFIDRYIAPLPHAERDEFGNWHVRIGESPIVWSCHTDTVHWTEGRQSVRHDPTTGVIDLPRKAKRGKNGSGSSCLGADDTAGVFLCVSMINADVPGHYIFHFGEEIGGNGSSDLARLRPDLLDGARFAIALDRQGFSDVITHQAGDRCCSDAFADSLADQLNRSGLMTFAPCDRGVFTDTANYTETIAECTNLSVGYFHQHSRQENVHARHLETLLTALCAIDPAGLVEDRKPGETEYGFYGHWRSFGDWRSSPSTGETECLQCGDDYDPAVSFARDFDRYCSPECEDDHGRSIARSLECTHTLDRQTIGDMIDNATNIYLDPAYADVARQLRVVFGETEDK